MVNGFEKPAALVFVSRHVRSDDCVAFLFINQFRFLLLLSCHFVCFVGKISGAENRKVNESDNTETEEECVGLKIADLD